MDFTFSLATPADDADLRQLLARSAMPGRITVTFEREPDYFLGCGVMGPFCQVLIARTRPGGELAGMMVRAARPHFVNGQPMTLGYVGQIRIAEKYQGRWLLARGMDFWRELHADGRTPVYWGVISAENEIARGVLVEHPRRAFPTARPAAQITTLGIILQRPKRPLPSPYAIRRAQPADLPEIVACLQTHGAAKQFFPLYTAADFAPGAAATRGFALQDLLVARKGGEIVGVVGLWDQSAYKQTVVQDYAASLRRIRPLYNLGARLLGAKPLPAPGEHIHSAYASFICVAENNPEIFRPLLRGIYNLAAARGYAHLMLGLAENDPLLPVAMAYPHIAYHSQMFLGYWPAETGDFAAHVDGRTPYVEIAAL